MKSKIGLVGCGRISANHLTAITELSQEFDLTAACDINTAALESFQLKHQVPTFRSISEMLDQSSLDIIAICTPSGLHAAQGIEAARKGCHVLTEKPMATRYEDGMALTKTCEQYGKQLFVMKQNRLNPSIRHLKAAIESGRFGRISNITSNVFWTRPQSYYDQAKWRGTWAMDGGAFMNQASHYVDLLTWLMGPIERLSSFTSTLGRRIEAEDCGVMAFKFRNGALGTLNVSMLTFPKNFEGSITVIGEKGLVRIGGVALNKVETWQFSEASPADEDAFSSSYETESVYGYGHRDFYKEVAKALRGEPHSAATGYEGLVSLATLVGAYRSSIDGGKPIGFPLDL